MRKLLNFKTENYLFKVYSKTDKENLMLEEISNDEKTKEFVNEYYNYILETENAIKNNEEIYRYTSIVYDKDNPVAIISLYETFEELIYSVVVRPSERGKNYSVKIRDELFNYIYINNNDIEKIIGFVDVDNINSIKSIKKSPYSYGELVHDSNDNKDYYKIVRINPYYKSKSKGAR